MTTVRAPGSCGELIQGTLDGKNFLITCPVDMYSEATIQPSRQLRVHGGGSKILEAIKKTADYLGVPNYNCEIFIKTELPVGKGMASSSADISAVCQAFALNHGKMLTPDEIANIALAIEPTDAIFSPGITLFDHLTGSVCTNLGAAPAIKISVFDLGGEVDTFTFNQRDDLKTLNKKKEDQVRRALALVTDGFAKNDPELIGEGATLSALANQSILFKRHLDDVIELSKQQGALGVNVAHSGTVVGVLFHAEDNKRISRCVRLVTEAFSTMRFIKTLNVISGGLEKLGGENCAWTKCF